jgi:hypothetical protein
MANEHELATTGDTMTTTFPSDPRSDDQVAEQVLDRLATQASLHPKTNYFRITRREAEALTALYLKGKA